MNKNNKQLYKTGGIQPDVDVKKYLENPQYTVVGLSNKGVKAMVLFYTLLCLFVGGTIFSYLNSEEKVTVVKADTSRLENLVQSYIAKSRNNVNKEELAELKQMILKNELSLKGELQKLKPKTIIKREIASVPSAQIAPNTDKKILKYSRAAKATMRYEHDLKIARFKQQQKQQLEEYMLTETNPQKIEEFRDKQKVALYGLKQDYMYKRIKFYQQGYLKE